MAVNIGVNTVTIQWTVSIVAYTPEFYRIRFGTTMNNLNHTKDYPLIADFVTTNVTLSIDLTGLEQNTNYYYRVIVRNSEGVSGNHIQHFMTKQCEYQYNR